MSLHVAGGHFLWAPYSPYRAAIFQPSPGGHVTVTSRSEKIFQMLKTSNPVLKTILMSLQAHSQRHKDCGLFTALLVLKYATTVPCIVHVQSILLRIG